MLEIRGLCKSFGGKPALADVSFSVARGEIHGLLGHNGAGKSATLGIILGMVMPDAGDVTIGGVSVLSDRSRALRKVGAIFEASAFYDYLSGWENLRLLMGYSGGFDAAAARETVDLVGLSKRIHSKVRTYSHGMRQRLALAQSLLPAPELLLLDEPTDGLDPEGIKWFRDFILHLRDERGMTVLFNSHLLAEVELMCDRVAILRDGKRVFEGAVGGLYEDDLMFEAVLDSWERARPLIRVMGGEIPTPDRIRLPRGVDSAALVESFVHAGIRLRSLAPVRRSLEDLYMEILNGAESQK
ncbi:MAG: ABC transporter ATP-binding protein [Luteolibacter sp.]|nr:ABC transporter ATP-binding protein [Luteolibacter sp.]